MCRIPAIVLVLIAFSFPLHAQERPVDTPVGESVTTVIFTARGELRPETNNSAALPLALLQRLAAQDRLATLETGSGLLEAKFAFSSMEAFRAWYTSADTQQLLEEIGAAIRHPPITSVALRRLPLADRVGG